MIQSTWYAILLTKYGKLRPDSKRHECQTGAGTSASRIGHADLGIASLNDMREHAEMIANLDSNVPLIADADTGYGGMGLYAKASLKR